MKHIHLSDLAHNECQILTAKRVDIHLPAPPIRYFRHGWQSWSLAAWTGIQPMPIQKPAIFHPLQVDPLYAREKKPNGSWLGAVEMDRGRILLLGAIGLDAHVVLDRDCLRGTYESGAGEWFVCIGDEQSVFSEYGIHLGEKFGAGVIQSEPPRVWCSWYSLYTAIDEVVLHQTLDLIGDLPFDVVQVDDGWQKSVGDWISNHKFPSGMAGLAGSVTNTGRKAGLWLAPLLAVKSSRLFQEHPGWFLRDDRGRFVSAGFNWGEHLYALDTTQPAVIEWLVMLMKQVREWGFDYLKLDFLYAAALPGKRYKDLPREQAYRDTLLILRNAMGTDAYFLACGTPILPALGIADAIRIGPDVADTWEKPRDAVWLYNHTTPGTRNAVRTVIHRLWLKALAHIDSDVAYFASRENSLTSGQKTHLQDTALICNFKATSDLPQWLTAEERKKLHEFLSSKSKVTQIDRYRFRIEERTVDFTDVVSLPKPPEGLQKVWAEILGWLGNIPLALKIIKRMDDRTIHRRRKSLD